jgi:hypothetical protein
MALRCGVSICEFWDMTPIETRMSIEAALWRDERRQLQDMAHARLTAILTRAKRIPSLKQMMAIKEARPLRGAELEKRRQEFKDMTANLDVSKLVRPFKREQQI